MHQNNTATRFYDCQEKIWAWLTRMDIKNFTILDDLSVNVSETVFLNNKALKFIPVQFNHVKGAFYCDHNYLVSLRGSPLIVDASFDCSYNFLKSLQYCPESIGSSLVCEYNYIDNVNYWPQMLGGSIIIRQDTPIKELLYDESDYINASLAQIKRTLNCVNLNNELQNLLKKHTQTGIVKV